MDYTNACLLFINSTYFSVNKYFLGCCSNCFSRNYIKTCSEHCTDNGNHLCHIQHTFTTSFCYQFEANFWLIFVVTALVMVLFM